ncbi:cutinase family protein [Pseudarthrobacter sp. HLT3-5]|uniref:cutinase family protein n=1 Tax=Pseudarthrobacter cellobiosi TaxID=2953654 RepID=UPI00208F6FDA|nr:cutinase family protein [Pseudarthrobacter sp. HLT3-5]MCO4273820.1 cutinase family protein [Pseudarthrobacter sp. HLT3-5]
MATAKDSSGNTIVRLTNTTPCQDVVFLGVRGSGEKPTDWGMGPSVAAVYNSFTASVKNRRIAATGIDYAAADVPRLVSLTPLGATAWEGYFASIDGGVHSAEATLINRSHNCPDERFVLAGYSQGAMAIHRIVFDLSRAPLGSALDRILPKIDAVATIGDGDRVAFDDVVTLGSSPTEGQDYGVGLAGLPSGASYVATSTHLSYVGHGLNSRWFQVCDYGDLVCDYGRATTSGPLPTDLIAGLTYGFNVHTKNYTKKNHAVVEAGRQLALTTMAANQLQVSYSPASASVGAAYTGTFNRDSGYPLTGLEMISGSLPPGLIWGGVSGVSGIPTQMGSWTFTYRASDRVGQTYEGTATIAVSPMNNPYDMAVRVVAEPVPAQYSAVGYNARYNVLVKNTGTEKFRAMMATSECSIPMETWGTTGQAPQDSSYVSPGEEWAWACWHPLTPTDISQGYFTATGAAYASYDAYDTANTVVIPTRTASSEVVVPVQMLTLDVAGNPLTRYDTDWTITLLNSGNVTITTSPLLSSRCGAVPLPLTTLSPGQSLTVSCSSTVTENYLENNMDLIGNSVSETAYGPDGQPYSANAFVQVTAPQ